VGVRRLRAGEWLAGTGGVALIVSLLLPWYGDDRDTVTGFEAFDVIDILLVAVAAVAIALAVLQATQDGPSRPVAAGVLSVPLGFLGFVLVLFRLVDEPDVGGVQPAAYAALVAAAAIVAGAWLSLTDEKVRGLPPDLEPELRPSPRIADRAQP
jgi:peptidoglycan/LPS O-acetylase OafA/YrhL